MWSRLCSVEINGHAEWDTNLICSCVTLANWARTIVHFMAEIIFSKLFSNQANEWFKFWPGGYRQDGALDRSNEWWQFQIISLFVTLAFSKWMLEHSVHDATDTERRLNNRWNYLLNILYLFDCLNWNRIGRQVDFLCRAVSQGHFNGDLVFFVELLFGLLDFTESQSVKRVKNLNVQRC